MKRMNLFCATLAITAMMTTTVLAGEWKQEGNGWKYQNDDGTYATGWIVDGEKSYYLNANGILLTSTFTPDDYYVGSDGACNKNSSSNYDERSYQGVLDSYTAKLKAATPILIAEYNAEARNNTKGLNGLAELYNSKLEILAQIENNGIEKMAGLWFNSSSGSYDEYIVWGEKLFDAYIKEGEILFNVYIDSAS